MDHQTQLRNVIRIIQKNKKTHEDLEELNAFLYDLRPLQLIMNNLSYNNRMQLLSNFTFKELDEGERLFTKGDISDCMYVIMEGSLQLYNHLSSSSSSDLIPENIMVKGKILGERGILKNLPRSLTAIAREYSCFLVLDAQIFKSLLGKEVYSNLEVKRKIIEQYFPGLTQYSATLKERLAYSLEIDIYLKGNILAKQGAYSDKTIIILEGECNIYVLQGFHRRILSSISKGSFIGDESPLFDKPSPYSIIVTSDSLKAARIKNTDVKQLFPSITIQLLKEAYLVRENARSRLMHFDNSSKSQKSLSTTQKFFPLASARAQEQINCAIQRKPHMRHSSLGELPSNYKEILEKLRDYSSTRLKKYSTRVRSRTLTANH